MQFVPSSGSSYSTTTSRISTSTSSSQRRTLPPSHATAPANRRVRVYYNLAKLLRWAAALPIIGFILFNSACLAFFSPSGEEAGLGVGEGETDLRLTFIGRVLSTQQQILDRVRLEDKQQAEIPSSSSNTNINMAMNHNPKKHPPSTNTNHLSKSSSNSNTNTDNNKLLNSSQKNSNGRLPASYNDRNSLVLFSKSQQIPSYFSLDLSTQENYGVETKEFHGPFAEIRAGLDFDYHGNYSKSRQEFQDKIIEKFLDGTLIHDATNGLVCRTPTEPWIVFTAGVMGAGKSHTMKQISNRGYFPLQSYVIVDPDEIRSHFPEYHLYASHCPKVAGELTHREAGYICEIVTATALRRGYNVLVDGSLRDYNWYTKYFESLRKENSVLRIAILHIVATRESVLERAKNRAKDTGRVVPLQTLEQSMRQVPISVAKLAPEVDFFCELDNSPGYGDQVRLKTEGITWESFRDNWAQTCPWVPGGHNGGGGGPGSSVINIQGLGLQG